MKRLLILLVSFFFISPFSAPSYAGKFESGSGGIFRFGSGDLNVGEASIKPIEPNAAIDNFQHAEDLAFSENTVLPPMPRSLDEAASSCDSLMGLYGASPVKADGFGKIKHVTGGEQASYCLDGIGLWNGPFFLSGPAMKERNPVPESSTMLLLGLGLVGLAGYGGRKKFKH